LDVKILDFIGPFDVRDLEDSAAVQGFGFVSVLPEVVTFYLLWERWLI
jgi:hypothetical protein